MCVFGGRGGKRGLVCAGAFEGGCQCSKNTWVGRGGVCVFEGQGTRGGDQSMGGGHNRITHESYGLVDVT